LPPVCESHGRFPAAPATAAQAQNRRRPTSKISQHRDARLAAATRARQHLSITKEKPRWILK
jgi:hypothetical protein